MRSCSHKLRKTGTGQRLFRGVQNCSDKQVVFYILEMSSKLGDCTGATK